MRNTPGAADEAQCHQLTQDRGEGVKGKEKGWTFHEGMSADGTLKSTNQKGHTEHSLTAHTHSGLPVCWLQAPHLSILCLISQIIAMKSGHMQYAFGLVIRSYQV